MSRDLIERTGPALAFKFADNGTGEFEGYAATFGGAPDSYGDIIAAGAFKATLNEHRSAGSMPALLWSHDPSQPLGRWLSMAEDQRGLKAKGRLTLDVPKAAEARALMKDGALALSIGFRTKSAERGAHGGRILKAVQLDEVSLVAMPANSSATITSVKSIDPATITDPRSFEKFLRASGFSRSFAVAVTAHGFKAAMNQRDAGEAAGDLARMIRASGEQILQSAKGR